MTKELIAEMERCLAALRTYQRSYVAGNGSPNTTHAAAVRATMDVTRHLARWRQTPVDYLEPK